MSSPQRIRYWIGIDPGEHTGIAVWDNQTKTFDDVALMTFWEADEYIEGIFAIGYKGCYEGKYECVFVLEVPQLNTKALYAAHDGVKEARKRERISRNVGANHNDAKRLAQKIERLGLLLIQVRPTPKGRRMINPKTNKPYEGKWHPEEVRVLTGYDGPPGNEHTRDAQMLAHRECARLGGQYYGE